MSAPISPAGATHEQQLLEVFNSLRTKQLADTNVAQKRLALQLNPAQGTVTLSATIPATYITSADGGVDIDAVEYIA